MPRYACGSFADDGPWRIPVINGFQSTANETVLLATYRHDIDAIQRVARRDACLDYVGRGRSMRAQTAAVLPNEGMIAECFPGPPATTTCRFSGAPPMG